MTIEEKLDNFNDISLETAKNKGSRDLAEFKEKLDKAFREHQEVSARRKERLMAAEAAECRIQSNRELSKEQIDCRRKLSDAEEELTEELFACVRSRLSSFRETPEYTSHLMSALSQILEYGEGGQVFVEIDETDKHLIPELTRMTADRAVFRTVKEAFPGGIRAAIPEKNIMIDRSFAKKLTEIRNSYRLEMKLNQKERR